jgi:hypothetical protein
MKAQWGSRVRAPVCVFNLRYSSARVTKIRVVNIAICGVNSVVVSVTPIKNMDT